MKVAVAGGSGYIGSHLVAHLLRIGHEVIVLDLVPPPRVLFPKIEFKKIDLRNRTDAISAVSGERLDAVFHLGSPSVMEDSFSDASAYIANAVAIAKSITNACAVAKIRSLVFSSSCSVYGENFSGPASETSPLLPMSPYAKSKVAVEGELQLFSSELRIGICRFFNVVGVDVDGGLFESHEPETHVLPRLVKATLGGSDFKLFGTDFPTRDGTAIRDYVDVRDIAVGLERAWSFLHSSKSPSIEVWNLGLERGISIRSLVTEVQNVTLKQTRLQEEERREGDPASISADSRKARRELGWDPQYTITESIESVAKSLAESSQEIRRSL